MFGRYELVPCTDLGLMICSVRGRIIVSKVKNQSIAGDKMQKIHVQYFECTLFLT